MKALHIREGRTDQADLIQEQIDKPPSAKPTVIVAGEDKRGKSSLINALVRRPGLSPVGVEVTTGAPITLYAAEEDQGFVMYYGDPERHPFPFDEARSLATVQGNPSNDENIRGVALGIPDCEILEQLILIDTPGVGGLESGHAALTLQRLKDADLLLFTLEAGAQFRGPELKFLQQAAERINRVVFAMTKVDNNRGWQQIMEDNRKILEEQAPRFAGCPMIAVSSTLAQKAATSSHTSAGELWKEAGFEELQRVLEEQVISNTNVLRAGNIVQGGLGSLLAVERNLAEKIEALTSPEAAQAALAAERSRLGELQRERVDWPQTLQVELRRLALDRNEELARGVMECRGRYDERTKEIKKEEQETIPGEFVADLTALVAKLNEWTEDRLIGIVGKLVGEIVGEGADIAESVRRMSDAAFAEELASVELGNMKMDSMDKMNVMMGYSTGHGLISILLMSGMFAVAAPIALGVGVVAGGGMAYAKFRHSKQTKFVQEFKSWMMEQVQRTQLNATNSFQRAQIEVEVGIRNTLKEAFAAREAEINEAVAMCNRALQQEQGERQRERQQSNVKLEELKKVKAEGLAVLAKAMA